MDLLPDQVYARLQQQLWTNPDFGVVLAGCGGLLAEQLKLEATAAYGKWPRDND